MKIWQLTLRQSQTHQHQFERFRCGQPTLAASFVNFGSAALAQLGGQFKCGHFLGASNLDLLVQWMTSES